MEPTRRHPPEPQDRSQREILVGPIRGAQDPRLGASVRQTLSREAKAGGAEQGQREPKQSRELLDAAPQLEDLLPEFRLREVRHIQTDDDRRRRGLGGFASATTSGVRTRRYHALLLTAMTPPTGRVVLVNGFDAWLDTPSGSFALS